MKRIILPLSTVAVVGLSANAFAAMPHATLTKRVDQLSAQTQTLEKEVAVLRRELKQSQQHRHRAKHKVMHPVSAKQAAITAPTADRFGKNWTHAVTVTTSPYLDKKMDFDGDDLIFNLSSYNEDLTLLQQREAIAKEMGGHIDRPIVQLSGGVESDLVSSSITANNGLALADATINVNAIASSWASAFLSLNYNGSPASNGTREPRSTLYVNRGFVTIGNLAVTPIYFTGGLMYVPFGRYANGMVTTPLTESLFRIRTTTALLGFSLQNGLYGSVYGFTGNKMSGASTVFRQGGANLGFKHNINSKDNYSLGVGVVSNIADSQGQQGTATSATTTQFSGFANNNGNNLVHNVNGGDVHGHLTIGDVNLVGEYLSAMERFAPIDSQFNGLGAEPSAMHAELDYTLPFIAKKYGTNVGFAYGHTWQALAFNLPLISYSAFLNTSIWRETQESIEYRHNTNYAATDVANAGTLTAINGDGKGSNTVTAQLSVFF